MLLLDIPSITVPNFSQIYFYLFLARPCNPKPESHSAVLHQWLSPRKPCSPPRKLQICMLEPRNWVQMIALNWARILYVQQVQLGENWPSCQWEHWFLSLPPTNATIDQAVLIHALTASAKCLGVSFSGYCQEERECCSAKFGGSREKGAISPIGATVAKQKSLPVGHRFCSDGRRLLALVCHSDKCTVLLLE